MRNIYSCTHVGNVIYMKYTRVTSKERRRKSTCKNLIMLLAPKTRWAIVNFAGSVGGKYGAKTHFSAHRRRKILQAAQGLSTTGGGVGCCGEGGGGGEEVGEGEVTGVLVSATVATATTEAVGVATPPVISIFSMILKIWKGLIW